MYYPQFFTNTKTALIEGDGDEYPEAAFYMVGNLEQAFEEGRKLAADAAKR